ncbi:MAG: GIY-YIG nuclease family protein [Candidatus Bathyarchaeaceae archaeon]
MSSIQALPTRGIYTLIIFLSKETCLNVGKLGMKSFPKGYYTYTGSALGRGATSLKQRISRHLRKRKRNLWHIDFLLANENAAVTAVVAAETSRKLECNMNCYMKWAGKAKIPVKGFGSSDCKENCGSHLLYFGEEEIGSKIAMFYAKQLKTKPIIIDFG